MNPDELQRFNGLKSPWCDFAFVRGLYGIELASEERFVAHFAAWAKERGGRPVVQEGRIHRHYFETFLQTLRLLPLKWGAVRLGMKVTSLVRLLSALADIGIVIQPYPSTQFVSENIDQDLYGLFEEFRFRQLSNHNDFCRRLHDLIMTKYRVPVEPEYCVTSQAITADKEKADYAHDWDAIALWPVGLRYQVWLDVGKPMNLRPDCCSTLLFAREKEFLGDFVLGTREVEIPPELTHRGV